MKKIIFFTILLYFASHFSLTAQNYNINPIPSYNYQITDNQALFGEINTQLNNSKEKRDMDVVISTANHSSTPIFAKVWVVKKSGHVVKGPYIVNLEDQLTVPIDHGKWGVIIKCDWVVSASVWIE